MQFNKLLMLRIVESSVYFVLRIIRGFSGLIGGSVVIKFFFIIIDSYIPEAKAPSYSLDLVVDLSCLFIGFGLLFSLRSVINYIHKQLNKGLEHPKLKTVWHL